MAISATMRQNKLADDEMGEGDFGFTWNSPSIVTIFTYFKICSVQFNRVLDVNFEDVQIVSGHDWINKTTPTIDTQLWNREAEKVNVEVRATDAQKYALETCANNMSPVELDNYSDLYNVWINRIRATYAGEECWEAPWRIEIELLVIKY